jgi:hypothetical protein
VHDGSHRTDPRGAIKDVAKYKYEEIAMKFLSMFKAVEKNAPHDKRK